MLEEKRFHTGVVTVNYGEGPAVGPPLILLHGGAGRWTSFLTVLPKLVDRWHVYALDHRGHGLSGRVPGAYRLVDYVEDAMAFMRHLGEPVVLWGQSLGANVAIGVAAQAAESVRAAVFEEPGLELNDPGPFKDFIQQMLALAESGRSGEELLPAVADITVQVPGSEATVRLGDVRAEGYLRLTADCVSRVEPEVLTSLLEGQLGEGYDLEALLPQVTCPALFLQGDPVFGGLEDEAAERAAGLLPNGRRVKIPGAGHNIHNTRPEAVLQAAGEFFASVL